MENCDQSFLIQLHRLVNFELVNLGSFSILFSAAQSLFGLMGDMSQGGIFLHGEHGDVGTSPRLRSFMA
jgi:hypothetical protein